MSRNSMAPSSSATTHDRERLDLQSMRVFVISVNQYILEFLADPETRKSLQLRCTSKLKIQNQEFFEFSEHSILSNLYWGIESIETAIEAKCPEERASQLKNSERMLQVPALLDEHGRTGGIPNHYLVCCSYFYLSLVRKLQKDDWQVTQHFLQALLVSPGLLRTEFAPQLCESLFLEGQEKWGKRSLGSDSLADFGEDAVDEAMRQMARRYKDWLMYHQVMSYGESPHWNWGGSVTPSLDEKPESSAYAKSTSTKYLNSVEHGKGWPVFQDFEKVHPLNDPQENIVDEMSDRTEAPTVSSRQNSTPQSKALLQKLDEVCNWDIEGSLGIKCLQDMLKESQSDTPNSVYSNNDSAEGSCLEVNTNDSESSMRTPKINADDPQPEIREWKLEAPCSISSNPECTEITPPESPGHPMHKDAYEGNSSYFFSSRFLSSISDLNLSISELRDIDSHPFCNYRVEEVTTISRSQEHGFRLFDQISSDHLGSSERKRLNSSNQMKVNEVCLHPEKDTHIEIQGRYEKTLSTLCFSEGLRKCDEDVSVEVSIVSKMLNNKTGVRYGLSKDVILDQLLSAISTSKEETVIRASVSILSTIILENRSVIEDVKKKGLRLYDLAGALKRNVHEAAILIYLINPSPTEIKALELLPALVEIVCTSNSYMGGPTSLGLTPPAVSLMMIEELVTAFDYATNNMHLAAINSPQVLSKLLEVTKNNNLEEFISLAAILVKCMRCDGKCRNFLSQSTPVAPFIRLLRSTDNRAKFTALEFFNEIFRIPRSSAIKLLHQIRQEGRINIMHILMSCLQQSQPEHQLLAANLLLQLDMLEDSSAKSVFREEAMEVLLESVASEESSAPQRLSAFILSNLGGTFAWTGEPYTAAWLVKKTGLTSLYHKNMIRNIDWLDQSLQEAGTDAWCSKIARSIIKIGHPVFHALEKGLRSKIKSVSRDCLTSIAWLGCEIATMSPSNLRESACEILLSGIEQFLHPGQELEERLLACLCLYNYVSGMQKLFHFSEGVRQSLRRLSNITWMAEELLKVADYFLPNKSRVSCVHTQILEAGHNCNGAASALIYYKGQLYSGYSDGSIKVWDIKGQTATLVWDVKEHKRAVTCFALFEPGDCLLSGSADKTVRVWQMVQRKLECVEVMETKEPIHKIDTHNHLIFVVTQSRGIKVFDPSRIVKTICSSKQVKCITVAQGKIYVGCMDSSIQELDITNNREREIKAPARSWRMQNKPINAVVVYKDCLYSASATVEGSSFKEWIRHNKPQMSIMTGKGTNVQAMGVVEDFIYLNCSSSLSILQVWLRGTQQKVGRLSAGSRITSLLTANDIVLCGTEMGLIKGWIPL
ncbi:hypothetical protein HHK36_026521 [Tetracentron sinense]|uniref:E3 ubiquitin-protein ligase LIN-1 n=1 Tax=Tetracentron sinense TaxID=13715 RepID=A0A835D5J9_TETSI|nr:hypothetical protein HHK36_026521 [Tetracentron sinense]